MSTCTSGKRCAVIRQVRWCTAVQTLVNCHCELKENSIIDVEPVELVVQQLTETTVELPGSTDNTRTSIQHVLQFVCDCFWCTCKNSIAVMLWGLKEPGLWLISFVDARIWKWKCVIPCYTCHTGSLSGWIINLGKRYIIYVYLLTYLLR